MAVMETRQIYRVKPGKSYWFEYHCEESDDSSDAELWYHSHQRAKVLKMTQTGDGLTEDDRAYNGQNAHYWIQFADGFEQEAGEDELMNSQKYFYRPNPPSPPAQRKDTGRKKLNCKNWSKPMTEARPPSIGVKWIVGAKRGEPRTTWVDKNLYWDEDIDGWLIPGTNYSVYHLNTVEHANHITMKKTFPWLEDREGNENDLYLYLELEKVKWMPLWNPFKRMCDKALHGEVIDPDALEAVNNEAIRQAWKNRYASEFAVALNDKYGNALKVPNPLKDLEEFTLSPQGFNLFTRRSHDIDEYWDTESKDPYINVQIAADHISIDELRSAMYPQKGQLSLINLDPQGTLIRETRQRSINEAEDWVSSFIRHLKKADPEPTIQILKDKLKLDYYDHFKIWQLVGYSNFSGSCGDIANGQYFLNQYPSVVSIVYGGYGTEIIGIKDKNIDKLDAETLNNLSMDLKTISEYPVIDEDRLYKIESEKREEAWENRIKKYFQQDLIEKFPNYEEALESIENKDTANQVNRYRELFDMARDRANEEWIEEPGANMSVRLDKIMDVIDENMLRNWLNPVYDNPAQRELPLNFPVEEGLRELRLFHGTSSVRLAGIETDGLRKPCLTNNREAADYFAQEEVETAGGHPIVLTVIVNDPEKLRADYASFEEPLTLVYRDRAQNEEEWHKMLDNPESGISWPDGSKDWQTSLAVVGSARYDGTIPPDSITANVEENLDESKKYSCVMAPAPPNLAQKVIDWGKMFITDDKLYIDELQPDDYGREDDVHITVKFGLHEPQPSEELLRILQETQPFEIEIMACSIFENELYDVVKFDVDGEALRALNARVSTLKNSDSHPEYHPHMTVAYVQKGCCKDLTGKPLLATDVAEDLIFLVKSVIFSSFNGKKRTLFLGKPNEIIGPNDS